ncbi:bacillithiol biosynthesis cysteine-adding enzyme BshC [Ammoniphilus sp. YIM 78166]|uniref:bacillithiol biosynthesis cysteine-adding enzyme BshC n=1 Tax=Ammoniphilus sp. YIM 78166 TaxID=1644106 RepID=UPI001430BF38|nr:bacillithiol biosynthesis cysteine-adding enzyme BshC [Ammoniphilus sp. YIM 78166]
MLLEQTKTLNGNRLVQDYVSAFSNVQDFFESHPDQLESWMNRRKWLLEHPLPHRAELVEGLRHYNRSLQNHDAAMKNIEELANDNTFVVVGGQQAGILTGPLYVIYKAITLIKLTKSLEEKTGERVVPVFWIASEDHDYDEVNHIYVQTWDDQVEKIQLSFEPAGKYSISHLPVNETSVEEFIQTFFSRLPDSLHLHALNEKVLEISRSTTTLNEFFARLLVWMFGEYGLILVDSAAPFLRSLEQPVFASFIQNDFSQELLHNQRQLIDKGYPLQVDIKQEHAHFFVYEEGKRQLIYRRDGRFQTKDGEREFTAQELLQLLEKDPCSFSANVVSRPLMQEYVFPVLAFVGGPGEIAYWAQLKPVFDRLGMKMPIVLPRLSFTIMERDVHKYMQSFHLSCENVYTNWAERRKAWMAEQSSLAWEPRFSQVKQELGDIYLSFIQELSNAEPGVRNVSESNWNRILMQVEYLEKKTAQAIEARHHAGLKQWEHIRVSLFPLEKPQERVYNIFGYLNKYGEHFIKKLLEQTFDPLAPSKHFNVYI